MKNYNQVLFYLSFFVIVILANLSKNYYPHFLSLHSNEVINHIGAFVFLGILIKRAFVLNLVETALLLLLMGVGIEFIQLLGGVREFSLKDVLFDIIGIAIFIILQQTKELMVMSKKLFYRIIKRV